MSTRDRSHPGEAASEQAYRWTKDRILDGRLEGGRLISEGEIADAVAVSRTPVREAFLRLSAEGLLRLYPKRGALVVPVSPAEISDIAEARMFLEQHAAAKIITAGRHAEVAARLAEILDRQRAVPVPAQTARFSALDREFHAALVHAAGNALFDEFYAGLRDRQLRMVNTLLHRDHSTRPPLVLDEHTRICALLAAGDTTALTELLTAHIGSVRDALRGG